MRAISMLYHDVVNSGEAEASGFAGPDAALYKLERQRFEEHLRAIAESTAGEPASVFEMAEAAGSRLPLLLTFDDGGLSAFTLIADRLEERGWRGHFLITTDCIGMPSFVTRKQIRALRQRGHVIGTHSCSHPARMTWLDREHLLREWTASVACLSDILGEQVTVASVPYGDYSRKVAEAAAEAGIRALFTSEPTTRASTVEGCSVLGRYTIQRWMDAKTAAEIAAGNALPRLRQQLLWNAKKVAKTLGGRHYLRIRKSLLEQRANQTRKGDLAKEVNQ